MALLEEFELELSQESNLLLLEPNSLARTALYEYNKSEVTRLIKENNTYFGWTITIGLIIDSSLIGWAKAEVEISCIREIG